MDIPDIGGLPAHPLIVHLPVVLVPLATIGALIMVIRPRSRRTYAIPTAIIASVAAVATQLAISSGESLEERVRETDLIERHSEIAEQARPFVFVFAAIMIAIAVWDLVERRRAVVASPSDDALARSTTGSAIATADPATRPPAVRSTAATALIVLTALGLVTGVASTVQVYRTGHSGATATWDDTLPPD